jgi:hypothetical protein
MTCDRYWREGILLVERGLDDPHRDGCEDCTHAHASRQELIEALPLIGEDDTGDPDWQAKVWQRIDGEHAHAPWRWRWQLAGALGVACVVALWIGLRGALPGEARPRIEIIDNGVAMRSKATQIGDRLSAHVDDRLRITVAETSDIWIYREDHLELQCPARQASERVPERAPAPCVPDADGVIVDLPLMVPETYRVIITDAPFARPPRGVLDEDRGTLEAAGVIFKEYVVSVR